MLVVIPKEARAGETRVALIPAQVGELRKAGVDVAVESGAGAASLHPDSAYDGAGARIETDRRRLFAEADLVLTVRGPGADPEIPPSDIEAMKEGAALIGFLDPLDDVQKVKELAGRGLSLLAMEMVPRTTRAQSMDALSSMATIAGYRAALLAAEAAPRLFPLLMTAAGTMKPSKVFVLGAGVAGLQAIATARRLGAQVEGYDVRPAVKEQVESLGARFVELPLETEKAEGEGGYAKAQSEEFYRKQQELLGKHLQGVDVIITTAAVPGKRAPVLITKAMIEALRPGTVIVDLAAERGGNCELTKPGETHAHQGVTVLGPMNLPAAVPVHASQMYSKNVAALVLYLLNDGALRIDQEDEITKAALITHGGEVVHPLVREKLAEG